jgi:DNA-binding transcriptional ArsR family regulator
MTEPRCCDFDDFVKAMADETRQRILALLQTGEMSVSELNEHFTTTQPTLSHHLAVLRRANLAAAPTLVTKRSIVPIQPASVNAVVRFSDGSKFCDVS